MSLPSNTHVKWMKEAFRMAKMALDLKEVPIGCVIVHNNQDIIGRGFNMTNVKKNATRHAEFEAIDEAIEWCTTRQLESKQVFLNSALYVTCEPCIMCASALKLVSINKWHYGCSNDRFGGCGSVLNLHNAIETTNGEQSIQIVSGICEDIAINMLQYFYTLENPNTQNSKANRQAVELKNFEDLK
jgi:tRNA-specific adenosine deaminase 2